MGMVFEAQQEQPKRRRIVGADPTQRLVSVVSPEGVPLSFPVAQVTVDGQSMGNTPVEMALPPGAHELILRQEGFGERTRLVELSAGENRSLETALIASNPDDPETLRRIASELDVVLRDFETAERSRGGSGGPPVVVLYPRGDVRLADLKMWRIDAPDAEVEIDGEIRFRRGEEILARIPFTADLTWTIEDLPASLKQRLAAGDEVAWGYYPAEGDPITATFRVVADPLAEELARLVDRLKDQPPAVLGHLWTQLCLDKGLFMAAFDEARRMAGKNPKSDRAWAAMFEALKGMGLTETPLASEVSRRYDRKPE